MSGLPLNGELLRLGARFLGPARTAPRYRLYCLDAFAPPRPGLLRQEPGRAIEVEVWELPIAAFGTLVAGIPAPLAIGGIELEGGEPIAGFLSRPTPPRVPAISRPMAAGAAIWPPEAGREIASSVPIDAMIGIRLTYR